MADAQGAIEAWRLDHNTDRPHSALIGHTPETFASLTAGARRLTPLEHQRSGAVFRAMALQAQGHDTSGL
jgi:Integrase core domain